MALIGYARVSSVGQSLDVQREKLKHCEKVFEEKRSGMSDSRPILAACVDYMRLGDMLVVTRLDWLARSTLYLCQIAEQLTRKGVQLQVLDQAIYTNDATGRLLFHMLGAIGSVTCAGFSVARRHSECPRSWHSTWPPRNAEASTSDRITRAPSAGHND